MSLPKGYTLIEYIETTGTQYIDTGIAVPHSTGRTIIEFAPMEVSADNPIAGYKYFSWSWDTNLAFVGSSRILVANTYGPSVVRDVFYKLEYTIQYYRINDGDSVSLAVRSYTDGYNNTVSYASGKCGYNKIKSYKLYNGDTLVRDLIPCINANGEVGMWDDANSGFYGSSGTGVFTAGPAIIRLDTPSNLAAMVSGRDAVLTWDADDNADGYRIYLGDRLAGDTAVARFKLTDLEPYIGYACSVTSYNEYGESEPASVLFSVGGNPRPLFDLITDRTAADVTLRTKKGSYNASDLNRVSAAADYVRTILANLGYSIPDGTDRVWFENDIPDIAEISSHHESILGLDVINYSKNKVVLPESLVHLTYEGANNVEKFLLAVGEAAERIPQAYIYSGEIYGGEND